MGGFFILINNFLFKRGYSQQKIQTNIQSEICNVCEEYAVESYKEEMIMKLPSNTIEDLENNVKVIGNWIRSQK